MADEQPIDSFRGAYSFLSNFYPASTWFEGLMYPSSEHAYQAAKTLDHAKRRGIMRCESALTAKQRGRRLVLRADWEQVKVQVMRSVLWTKFFSDDELAGRLRATAPRELIEGNTWGDTFWGAVRSSTGYQGQNWLGKLLMEIRGVLIAEASEK